MANLPRECYYSILGVSVNATLQEIKDAYKRKSLLYHPDKNVNIFSAEPTPSNERFLLIREAYLCLSNPESRRLYDLQRNRNYDNAQLTRNERVGQRFSAQTTTAYNTSSALLGGINYVDITSYKDSMNVCTMNDGPSGFFTVYRKLFMQIIQEENVDCLYEATSRNMNNRNGLDSSSSQVNLIEAPSFGYSNSDENEVMRFYSYWENFSTRKIFHNMPTASTGIGRENRAERRRLKRMREEYLRTKRREYNQDMSVLISKLKRVDPRYKKIMERRNLERRNMQIRNLMRRRERENLETQRREQEKMQMEKEKKNIQVKSDQQMQTNTENNKKKQDVENKEVVISDAIADNTAAHADVDNSSKETLVDPSIKPDVTEATNACAQNTDKMIFYCSVCKKYFKTKNQLDSHNKSKKHKQKQISWLNAHKNEHVDEFLKNELESRQKKQDSVKEKENKENKENEEGENTEKRECFI